MNLLALYIALSMMSVLIIEPQGHEIYFYLFYAVPCSPLNYFMTSQRTLLPVKRLSCAPCESGTCAFNYEHCSTYMLSEENKPLLTYVLSAVYTYADNMSCSYVSWNNSNTTAPIDSSVSAIWFTARHIINWDPRPVMSINLSAKLPGPVELFSAARSSTITRRQSVVSSTIVM